MTTVESVHEVCHEDAVRGGRSAFDWRWFWIGLLAVGLPMLVPYLIGLWGREHYQFFPFAFVVVGVLAYVRSDGHLYPPRGWIAWISIAAAGCCIAGSLTIGSPWLGAVGFVLIASACLASMRGLRDSRLLTLALPLMIVVRLPINYDQVLMTELQRITTQLTSVVLDVLAVPHAVSGNVIQLAGRELFVAEACSGIQSVFTLAFLACSIIAYARRRFWMTPLYLAIATILAVGGNVLRVTLVAVGDGWFDLDLASGWAHELIGYVTLGVAALWLLSFDSLLVTLLHRVEPCDDRDVENPLLNLWNALFTDQRLVYGATLPTVVSGGSTTRVEPRRDAAAGNSWWAGTAARHTFFSVTTLAVVVSSVQAGRLIWSAGGTGEFLSSELLFSPPRRMLGDSVGCIEVVDHLVARDGENPRLGKNADVWNCRINGHRAQLVLSQTYRGWHELCVCYENNDWRLLKREIALPAGAGQTPEDVDSTDDDNVPVALGRFKSRSEQAGYLFYTALTGDAQAIEPPPRPGVLRLRFADASDQRSMMMLQLWITAERKIPADLVDRAEVDFYRIREKIVAAIRHRRSAATPQRTTDD